MCIWGRREELALGPKKVQETQRQGKVEHISPRPRQPFMSPASGMGKAEPRDQGQELKMHTSLIPNLAPLARATKLTMMPSVLFRNPNYHYRPTTEEKPM